MKIILTEHARERLQQRNIYEKDLHIILRHPKEILPKHRGRFMIRGISKNKHLELIVILKRNTCTIITAYEI